MRLSRSLTNHRVPMQSNASFPARLSVISGDHAYAAIHTYASNPSLRFAAFTPRHVLETSEPDSVTTADCGRAGGHPRATARKITGSMGKPCKSTLVSRCECQDEWETACTDEARAEVETGRLRCKGRGGVRGCTDGEGATYTTPEAHAGGSYRNPFTGQVGAAPRTSSPAPALHTAAVYLPLPPPPRPPSLHGLAPGRWTAISTRARTPRSTIAPPWPAPGGTGHACSSWPPSPSPSLSPSPSPAPAPSPSPEPRTGARSQPLGARRFSVTATRVPESTAWASGPRDWRCSCS